MGESKVKVFQLRSQPVPLSAHRYFWDDVYTCPCPANYNPAKFYRSLAFFLIHVLENSVFHAKKYGKSVPVPKNWIRASDAQYALDTHRSAVVRAWLDHRLHITEHDRLGRKCREYEFKNSWIRKFKRLLILDEAEYELQTEIRRKPVSLSLSDRVAKSLRTDIKPKSFKRTRNFQYKEKYREVLDMIHRAEQNQVPYRLRIDRLIDCLNNLRRHDKTQAYVRLKGKFDAICKLGIRLVDDSVSGDRLVEFYDQYRFAEKGSRLFGTAQGLPKIVKRLCFEHSYGTNYDMPNAQLGLCMEYLIDRGIDASCLQNVDHSKTARALGVTRDTAKALMFGGMFKIWRNIMWFPKRREGHKQKMMMTDLHKCLRTDPKIVKILAEIKEANPAKAHELQNAFISGLWSRWKKEHADIARTVTLLCKQFVVEGRTGQVMHKFTNEMACCQTWETKTLNRGKTLSTILSHQIQGRESYRLLQALSTNKWCSAEFDGGIIVGEYNNIVRMDRKGFCDDTINILLFEKLWANGLRMGSLDRCILTKKTVRDMDNTVNELYHKYAQQQMRK